MFFFFSGLGYRGSLRELWVHHLVARLGEKLCLCQQELFLRFLWGKDLSSRQLRHQAEGVMFCAECTDWLERPEFFWRKYLQLHYVVLGACLWGHCQGKWWHSAQLASLLNPSSNQSFDHPLQQCQDAFLRSNPREIWGSDQQISTKLGSFVLDQSQGVTWFCDWYCSCPFGSRIWPLCGRNSSRRMTRIQAEISCILTTFCDIFQMRGVKKWQTQQWHQLDEIAKWGVTLADLKKGCQAHAKRWLNFLLTISGFGFILEMIRYCTCEILVLSGLGHSWR